MHPTAVADPGFSEGGAPTPKSAIIFQIFCRKLHENETIWSRGASWHPPSIRQCIGMHTCFTIYLDLHSRVQGFGASNQGDPRHVQMG